MVWVDIEVPEVLPEAEHLADHEELIGVLQGEEAPAGLRAQAHPASYQQGTAHLKLENVVRK